MSARVDALVVEEAADGLMVKFSKPLSLCEDNIAGIAAGLFGVADRLAQRTLSLDLDRVYLLSSTALGQLITLHKKVRAGGGRLVLCNASPLVYEVFKVTRVHTILEITPAAQPPPGLGLCHT